MSVACGGRPSISQPRWLTIREDEARPGWKCFGPMPGYSVFPGANGPWSLFSPHGGGQWDAGNRVFSATTRDRLVVVSHRLIADTPMQACVAAVRAWGTCLDGIIIDGKVRLLAEHLKLEVVFIARRWIGDPWHDAARGIEETYGIKPIEVPGVVLAGETLLAAASAAGLPNVGREGANV